MSLVPANASIPVLPYAPLCFETTLSLVVELSSRVVFDGSGATGSPAKVAAHPFKVPLPSVITGDICKMYRCVRVDPEDSYSQCILWRDSTKNELQFFKLDTVTYRIKPESFLSVRAMRQLAEDEQPMFPKSVKILRRAFYVDDLISGDGSLLKLSI